MENKGGRFVIKIVSWDFRSASEFLRCVDNRSAILDSVVSTETKPKLQIGRLQHLSKQYAIHLDVDRQNNAEYKHQTSQIGQLKSFPIVNDAFGRKKHLCLDDI